MWNLKSVLGWPCSYQFSRLETHRIAELSHDFTNVRNASFGVTSILLRHTTRSYLLGVAQHGVSIMMPYAVLVQVGCKTARVDTPTTDKSRQRKRYTWHKTDSFSVPKCLVVELPAFPAMLQCSRLGRTDPRSWKWSTNRYRHQQSLKVIPNLYGMPSSPSVRPQASAQSLPTVSHKCNLPTHVRAPPGLPLSCCVYCSQLQPLQHQVESYVGQYNAYRGAVYGATVHDTLAPMEFAVVTIHATCT